MNGALLLGGAGACAFVILIVMGSFIVIWVSGAAVGCFPSKPTENNVKQQRRIARIPNEII